MKTSDGAELAVVGDDDDRAAAIRDRRHRLGIKSQVLAASESKRLGLYVSLDAIKAAEKGTASDATYQRLKTFYDAFEEEIGQDDSLASGESNMVTVQISGNFGVSATVQGPVGDIDELRELATALIREMRSDAPE